MNGFAWALRAPDVQGVGGAPSWARRGLLGVTFALVVFGLLSVYSASSFLAQAEGLPDSHYLIQQAGRAGVGLVVLVAATFIDYRLYQRLAWPLMGVTVVLLVLLVLPWTTSLAPEINGARRWLFLGMAVQPSELAKLAVVVWTAALAVKKQDRLQSLRYGLCPFLVVLGPVCLLILAEPHFSAAVIVAALAFVVLFAAGGRLSHFLFLGLLSLPFLWDQVVNTGYRMNRILAFLNPGVGADDIGYQLRQSLIAVGSGGVVGRGYGESTQKLYYLPEPQNDFIYPIIAEEWGLLGAGALLVAFLLWTFMGLKIADCAPDLFGRLLAVGLTAIVAVGAFAHVGVTVGLLPTTGVNLPFVSAGGTGLVLALGATGILANIAGQRRC